MSNFENNIEIEDWKPPNLITVNETSHYCSGTISVKQEFPEMIKEKPHFSTENISVKTEFPEISHCTNEIVSVKQEFPEIVSVNQEFHEKTHFSNENISVKQEFPEIIIPDLLQMKCEPQEINSLSNEIENDPLQISEIGINKNYVDKTNVRTYIEISPNLTVPIQNHNCDQCNDIQKNHKCEDCDKKFCTTKNLEKHVKTVHEEKLHPTFHPQTTSNLRIDHEAQKSHKCIICGKEFSKLIGLKEHIKNCETCFKEFSDKYYHLIDHNYSSYKTLEKSFEKEPLENIKVRLA